MLQVAQVPRERGSGLAFLLLVIIGWRIFILKTDPRKIARLPPINVENTASVIRTKRKSPG
jgi:hypothetical protein